MTQKKKILYIVKIFKNTLVWNFELDFVACRAVSQQLDNIKNVQDIFFSLESKRVLNIPVVLITCGKVP